MSNDQQRDPPAERTDAVDGLTVPPGGHEIDANSDRPSGALPASEHCSRRSSCSRSVKTDVEPVDPEAVLATVRGLSVSTWRYRGAEEIRHMGPMAEDFHEAFGLGIDDEHITGVDADGVALAAIQGLADRLDRKDDRIDRLEAADERNRDRIDDLSSRVSALEAHLDGADERGSTATEEPR